MIFSSRLTSGPISVPEVALRQGFIQDFARSVSIAPFIVVGRLQKEERVGYKRLSTLKRRYEWAAG